VQLTDEHAAQQVTLLCEALAGVEDVPHVHAKFEIPEELQAKIPA
jgi:hypothetical protein